MPRLRPSRRPIPRFLFPRFWRRITRPARRKSFPRCTHYSEQEPDSVARAIVMPSMGMYTEEGVLTAWLRPAGSRITLGDPVAEITTEKATFEIPAPEGGTLHTVAAVGTTLRVESLMGYILQDGDVAPWQSVCTRLSSSPHPLR